MWMVSLGTSRRAYSHPYGGAQRFSSSPLVDHEAISPHHAVGMMIIKTRDCSPSPELVAATIPQSTVAQYAQYFSYLEVGIFTNSFEPYEVW
jgi:hypothetical protein